MAAVVKSRMKRGSQHAAVSGYNDLISGSALQSIQKMAENEQYTATLRRELEDSDESLQRRLEHGLASPEMPLLPKYEEPEPDDAREKDLHPGAPSGCNDTAPEGMIEWVPSCDMRQCLCICRYKHEMDELFQSARALAANLLGYSDSAKVADHACEVEGSWPAFWELSEILRSWLRIPPPVCVTTLLSHKSCGRPPHL